LIMSLLQPSSHPAIQQLEFCAWDFGRLWGASANRTDRRLPFRARREVGSEQVGKCMRAHTLGQVIQT